MAGALDGLMVLDLTTHLSGPFCGMQLGDLGADVIKIESPQGDSMRGAPPFVEGEGAPFMLWNRNKRGIRLDLKDAADLEVFWDLVDDADVVLENFRPGVMKPWAWVGTPCMPVIRAWCWARSRASARPDPMPAEAASTS
jgi:crotonobetainyl-CoA:carnitine CoA-transferase CaiB-like acyl-CoA transferase